MASSMGIKYMNIVRSIFFLILSATLFRFFMLSDSKLDYLHSAIYSSAFLLIGLLCYSMARQCKKDSHKTGNALSYRIFVVCILISFINIIIPFIKLIGSF